MFLRLTVSLAALVATATANTSDLDEWKHTLTKDECIFRVIDAASGKKYSYDFSSHMNDLVHDSSNYELKLNLCAPVETACYPSTCSNHAPHGFEGTPCLPWNATENTGHMIVTSTEDGGPPDPVGTNYPKNKCDPNKFDPKYTAGCPGPDDCCQKQCFSGTGQPEECTKACAVIASSEPYVQLQFPNKTKEGLQFTFNPVASGNDPRIPEMSQFNCGANGGKYFGTATVDCDEDPGATKMIILSVTNIGCFYQIRLKAKAACQAHPFVPIPVEPPKGWSAFGVFVFIIFLGFLLYFVLGTMYNGIYGTMGWEIPHKHFWRSCATSCYGRVQSCCGSAMGSRSDYNDFGSNHYSVGKSNPVYQANPAEHTVVYDDL
jgi:hypothetical protein